MTLLQCTRCRVSTFIKQVELDHGDWIAVCSECGAQNILALMLINKVPVLGSIPLLGRLFSNKSVNNVSTNLLIFITARTVSADGGAPEDVFDPRAIAATGLTRDELPGYRAPKGTDVYAAPAAPAKK